MMGRRGPALLLAGAMLVVAGCGGGLRGGDPGPVVSPTGHVYEAGTPPVETRYSQTASLYLRRDEPKRAAELAEEGVGTDPENPIHYFLAGVAHLRTGRHETADRMFNEAERLYPAYELEIEPEREAAWAEAFNEGVESYAAGDAEEAMAAWTGAALIYDLRPEAHVNLAMLFVDEGRYGEAAELYEQALEGLERRPATRVLDDAEVEEREAETRRLEPRLASLLLIEERFAEAEPLLRRQLARDPADVAAKQDLVFALVRQGKRREAKAIYDGLRALDLDARELRKLAVALFRAQEFAWAGELFGRLAELRPNSREAWYNYGNALFAARAWEALVAAGDRLLALDPLGENTGLIVARAHLETGDEEGALRRVRRTDAAPVYLEGLAVRPGPEGSAVIGRVKGNVAKAGDPLRVRFTFYRDGRELGTEIVRFAAPATGDSEPFRVPFRSRATSFRYDVLEPDT